MRRALLHASNAPPLLTSLHAVQRPRHPPNLVVLVSTCFFFSQLLPVLLFSYSLWMVCVLPADPFFVLIPADIYVLVIGLHELGPELELELGLARPAELNFLGLVKPLSPRTYVNRKRLFLCSRMLFSPQIFDLIGDLGNFW